MTRQTFSSAIVAALALTACSRIPLPNRATPTIPPTTLTSDVTEATEVAPPATARVVETTEAVPVTTEAPTTTTEAPAVMNIDTDGPTVCIDAALEQLGADAMVNEIVSYFQSDIDEPLDADEGAAGDLIICKALYQDPSNPIKLLGIQMNTLTGEFSEPAPVEISYSGDASEFDLNDYVIPATDIDTSIIKPRMDEEAPRLDGKFGVWRWDGVSLAAPGPFADVHVFDLRVEGRLAKNDLRESGYMTIAMDGSIVLDYLDG